MSVSATQVEVNVEMPVAMEQLMVTVPPGITEGMVFGVDTPNGPMQVACPEGVSEGQQMIVNVPAAAPQQQAPQSLDTPVQPMMPVVAPVPAEPAEPAGPEEAAKIQQYGVKPRHEEQAIFAEIAKIFDILDRDNNRELERDEFKKAITKMDLHRPEGAADGWKDDAFDKFDVDKKGSIDYNEFLFAMAQTVFSKRAQGSDMSALDCFKEVLGATQEAQSTEKSAIEAVASGTQNEYEIEEKRRQLALNASVDSLHAKTSDDEFEDSCGAVVCVAIWPFALCCCTPLGCASFSSDNPLKGLQAVVGYVTKVKDTNPKYNWSIQNYHYETRTRTVTDSEGRTTTKTERVRVNTHFAKTSGVLHSTDQSKLFVPNMRKRNCALGSSFDVEIAPAFAGEYNRRKQMFYSANTRDTHQDKSDSKSLPNMIESVRCEWADDGEEDPCYANGCCMVMSVLTCTQTCWFLGMRNFMCTDSFKFQKQAHGFAHFGH